MRTHLRKLLSAALAAVLLVGALPAYASDALGHDLAARGTLLALGTELSDGTFWSDSYSDFRRENYVVYTPNERVSPLVTYGDTTRALTSLPNIAKGLEEQGLRVIAGINGDYYGVAHGVPLGSTITDGVVRNANHDPYYAVGFRADGTALIGDPQLHIHTKINGAEGPEVFAYNHVRITEYGIFLYDHNFNSRHTTGTSEPGVDVILSCADALTLTGSVAMVVEEVLPEATDSVVEEGKYILSANLQSGESYTAPLLALQPGDVVTVSVDPEGAGDWRAMQNLIGAPELLVENGKARDGFPAGSAPRTAIGQRADGSLLFYTIDGRRSGHSVGATLEMVAMRLAELDCVTAVALDGGGSTTLVATMPNEISARVVNTPSDGNVRAVSNHIVLVAPNTPSGVPDRIYLAPAAEKALPGARVALTAAVIDTNGIPMDAPVSFSADAGSVADGVWTAPAEIGAASVTATGAGLTATAKVEVALPDAIVFQQNGATIWSLNVAPSSSTALTARGVLNHLPLAGGNDCFEWNFEGEGVTFLPDEYALVSGTGAGAGTLTVKLGEKTASLPVTVTTVPCRTGADFEEAFEPLASADWKTALSHVSDSSRVHNGRGAARLDYTAVPETDADAFAASVVPVNIPIPGDCDAWSVWMLADKQSAFELIFDNGARSGGMEYRPDDSGWRTAAGQIPAGAKAVTGVAGYYAPDIATGTIWLDQLVFSQGSEFDDAAPDVALTLDAEANALAGRAFDTHDGAALQTLRLTMDGAVLPFTYDKRTGALTAALPEADGLAHHVALVAGDASGNLARASVLLPAAEGLPPAFPDAESHWAAGAIEFLKRTGVSNGDDKGNYNPDTNITRQEFAAMLCRYLSPEGDFGGVELPFADSDKIAVWAKDSARAMYALGVVNGSRDSDGKLRYHPQSNITRREAVTMLGRLLEKGYAAPELTYADRAEIPDWAAEHVARLGSMGVFDDFVIDTFSPSAPITRAEVAACLLRLN